MVTTFRRCLLTFAVGAFGAALGLCVLAQAAVGQVVKFDDLSPGTQVTTQYAPQGVVFASSPFSPPGLAPVIATPPTGEAQSSPQVADISVCPGCEFFAPFATATFSETHRLVSVRVGKFDDAASTGDTITLTGFDATGAVIATANATLGAPQGFHTRLAIHSPDARIAGIRVEGSLLNDHVGIDNLRFRGRQVGHPDFAIDPATASLTVRQGTAATTMVGITRLNGSAGNVQFSASGLPTGVTASFSPNPAGGVGTTMTLTASSSAPIVQVAQPVTITATPLVSSAGPQSRTATLGVIVAPNFSVSANPSVLTAWSCSAAPGVHIQVVRTPGFTGDITLSAQGVPPGVTATFNPAVLTNPTDGGFVNTSTLTFDVPQSGPTGSFSVVIQAESADAPSATTQITVDRRTGEVSGFSPTTGIEPQDLRAGTQVELSGHGLCPGSTVEFASSHAIAPTTFVSPDHTSILTNVPRYAVTGPLIVSTPFGDSFSSSVPFAPTSYRARFGFSFTNPSIGGYSFSDVKEAYGGDQVDISFNPCLFFDCTIDTGIPSPEGLIFWGILDASLTDGQCFGVSLSTQRLVNGDAAFGSFPPPGATVPWQLEGPAGASPPLLHYVHLQHSFQLSAEFLHYALGQMAENLVSGGGSANHIASQVQAALTVRAHPLVIMEQSSSGHVVVAYDLEPDPAQAGAYYIDVYDPNTPFASAEFSDGGSHFSRVTESRIHVSPNGNWSFNGAGIGYAGGPGSLYVAPYGVIPIHPTNPVSLTGILTIISPLGTGASVSQVANGQGRHLFNPDGTMNTDPSTRLTTAAPFAPIERAQQPHPSLIVAKPGFYTASLASDGSASTYGAVATMPGMTVSVTGVPQSPSDDDLLTLEPGRHAAMFATHVARKPVTMSATHSGSGGTRRTLTVSTVSVRNGGETVGFRSSDGAFTLSHAGFESVVNLRLSASGGSDLPGVFQVGSIRVAAGDRVFVKPSSWHDLSSSSLRVTILHRNGGVIVRHFTNPSPFVGHVSISHLSAIKVRPHGTRLSIESRFAGIPDGSRVVVAFQVFDGRHHRLLQHVHLGSAPTTGRRAFSFLWHHHVDGSMTFIGSVVVLERRPLASHQATRRQVFK